MHVISPKFLRAFRAVHPDAHQPLAAWLRVARRAEWLSFAEVQADFGRRVDRYKEYVIFDIGGNKYRLIAAIHYNRGRVYIRHVLTHAEYDRDRWKDE